MSEEHLLTFLERQGKKFPYIDFFLSKKVCQEIMLPLALADREQETEPLSLMAHKKLKIINSHIV